MGKFEAWTKRHLTEPQPKTKELTDTQRMDFLNEYALGVTVKEKSAMFPRIVTVSLDDTIIGKGFDWRQAVDAANAIFQEINR